MIEYCVEIKFEIILSRGHHFISCFSKQKKLTLANHTKVKGGHGKKGKQWD